MHEKTEKSTNLWTEQHERFCLKHKIPPAAQRLWKWLLWQGEETHEIEPDISEFNNWAEKSRGQKYDNTYLKKMLNLLVECRVVQLVKTFSWKIHRLVLRPLEWLKPLRKQPEKKFEYSEISSKTQPTNADDSDASTSQQQPSDYEVNKEVLLSAGIEYNESEAEIFNRPQYEVKAALAMFHMRGGFEKIDNPEGFIRACLRREFWKTTRNYVAIIRFVLGIDKHESIPMIDLKDLFQVNPTSQ